MTLKNWSGNLFTTMLTPFIQLTNRSWFISTAPNYSQTVEVCRNLFEWMIPSACEKNSSFTAFTAVIHWYWKQRESIKENLRIQWAKRFLQTCSGNNTTSPANEGMLPTAWTHSSLHAVAIGALLSHCCFVFLTKLRPSWGLRFVSPHKKTAEHNSKFSELVAGNHILKAWKNRATYITTRWRNISCRVAKQHEPTWHMADIDVIDKVYWLTQVLR